jgi:hypothetical protein
MSTILSYGLDVRSLNLEEKIYAKDEFYDKIGSRLFIKVV